MRRVVLPKMAVFFGNKGMLRWWCLSVNPTRCWMNSIYLNNAIDPFTWFGSFACDSQLLGLFSERPYLFWAIRDQLLPYLPAGRCRGDTRVFPGWLRVITGRLSKEEAGKVTLGLLNYYGLKCCQIGMTTGFRSVCRTVSFRRKAGFGRKGKIKLYKKRSIYFWYL